MSSHPAGPSTCCVDAAVHSLTALVRQSADFEHGQVTDSTIGKRLGPAKAASELDGHSFDDSADKLILGRVKMQFTILQDEAVKLTGEDSEHEPWLAEAKARLLTPNGFWDNYRKLLSGRLPESPLNRLDEITDQILESLESPRRPGQWDRRGLVMGQVQSGKTNNYTGLVCKAADAGYKLIIILAGTHNNLRAQTQFRIDEGVTGRDTRLGATSVKPIGVGFEKKQGAVLSLTSATDHGDFKAATANAVGFDFGSLSSPTVFVVKKHVSVLKNLHDWIHANAAKPEGHERVSGIPLLMIDDEADNASINTANMDLDPDVDPTRTNLGIRRILNSFDQTGYVGYTATPFANIFIDDQSTHEEVGDDLFPRDFLISIPAPSNYVGPERIFGRHTGSDDADDTLVPLISSVTDSDNWIPAAHSAKLEVAPEQFPDSLDRAIRSFILSCAASRARMQGNSHRSMLIHVTPFVQPQKQVREQVADRLIELKNNILYDQTDRSDVIKDLAQLWQDDFLPSSRLVRELRIDDVPLQSFDDIQPFLAESVGAIDVRMINGSSIDALDYFDHPTGLSTIVIGGAKLSRGLTLEGLVVSYYLRSTKMYDTLMQMGRWFGYRPGYLDLCRVYTTPEITSWYRNISSATGELLDDLQRMNDQHATPRDFGLRVRDSPGMMVTAQAKMRHGTLRRVSFASTRPETTSFDVSQESREQCIAKASDLIESLGPPTTESRTAIVWGDVGSSPIIEYFRSLDAAKLYLASKSAVPRYLADYIASANRTHGLTSWTVVLKSSSASDASSFSIAGYEVGLAKRSQIASGTLGIYAIKGLIGSKDESLDLTTKQMDAAQAAAGGDAEVYGRFFRMQRPPTNGLLILYPLDGNEINGGDHVPSGDPFIGYAMSMPHDPDVEPVQYRVNNVYER